MKPIQRTLFTALGVLLAVVGASKVTPPKATKVAETRSPRENSWTYTVVCKHCGETYEVPRACTFTATDIETKHQHITPEQEARAIQILEAHLKTSPSPEEKLWAEKLDALQPTK
ncbi:hypothetical protein [Armatimonas sp.]|uniref:hypothetical protein n=1 Tax=Armatimonas sp. TaxID=1872638 RepID=UPI0037513C58